MILDEAVSALDKSVEAQVLNLLLDLKSELGLTYIFISHDLNVVQYVSDRVMVMYLGKVVEIGPVERIYGSTAHPYTRALLSAMPSMDPAHRTEAPPLQAIRPTRSTRRRAAAFGRAARSPSTCAPRANRCWALSKPATTWPATWRTRGRGTRKHPTAPRARLDELRFSRGDAMTVKVSEAYVSEVLAIQGAAVAPEAPKAIAAALGAQLAAAAPAYAALPFEAEPPTFLAVLAKEQP